MGKVTHVLSDKPKASCKYCYGRGYECVDLKGVPVPCRCFVRKRKQYVVDSRDRVTRKADNGKAD